MWVMLSPLEERAGERRPSRREAPLPRWRSHWCPSPQPSPRAALAGRGRSPSGTAGGFGFRRVRGVLPLLLWRRGRGRGGRHAGKRPCLVGDRVGAPLPSASLAGRGSSLAAVSRCALTKSGTLSGGTTSVITSGKNPLWNTGVCGVMPGVVSGRPLGMARRRHPTLDPSPGTPTGNERPPLLFPLPLKGGYMLSALFCCRGSWPVQGNAFGHPLDERAPGLSARCSDRGERLPRLGAL